MGTVVARLDPNTVVGLDDEELAGPWVPDPEPDEPGLWVRPDDPSTLIGFATHSLTLDGVPHQLAVWVAQDDASQVDAALFARTTGGWKLLWLARPFVDLGNTLVGDVFLHSVKFPLLSIAPNRTALLYTPSIQGCGDECTEEDDYVKSRLIEITTTGSRELWTLESGPPCDTDPPDSDWDWLPWCLVSVRPGATGTANDLIVQLYMHKKHSTRRYRLSGGAYQLEK